MKKHLNLCTNSHCIKLTYLIISLKLPWFKHTVVWLLVTNCNLQCWNVSCLSCYPVVSCKVFGVNDWKQQRQVNNVGRILNQPTKLKLTEKRTPRFDKVDTRPCHKTISFSIILSEPQYNKLMKMFKNDKKEMRKLKHH